MKAHHLHGPAGDVLRITREADADALLKYACRRVKGSLIWNYAGNKPAKVKPDSAPRGFSPIIVEPLWTNVAAR